MWISARCRLVAALLSCCLLVLGFSGCAVSTGGAAQDSGAPKAPDIRRVDPAQARRLYNIMTPLLAAMNRPKRPSEVKIGILDDESINAANAGGGQFYVTRGLLERASDEQLRGVMAHEIAHDDLGHVAKLQVLGTGLQIGVVLLEQLLPGSSAVTPIAGSLIARGYSRSEEYAADRHGVELLTRTGHSKQTLINALTWIAKESGGGGGGGFLSTHPATDDRIAELRRRA